MRQWTQTEREQQSQLIQKTRPWENPPAQKHSQEKKKAK